MHKTISVYFSGTGFSITNQYLLAGSLYTRTEESESQIKKGFNGCGVDYGFNGIIFGAGLDKQCAEARDCVVKEIKRGIKSLLTFMVIVGAALQRSYLLNNWEILIKKGSLFT